MKIPKIVSDNPMKPLDEYTKKELQTMIAWASFEVLEWKRFIKKLKEQL